MNRDVWQTCRALDEYANALIFLSAVRNKKGRERKIGKLIYGVSAISDLKDQLHDHNYVDSSRLIGVNVEKKT
jgi:hypothetical protein